MGVLTAWAGEAQQDRKVARTVVGRPVTHHF